MWTEKKKKKSTEGEARKRDRGAGDPEDERRLDNEARREQGNI